MSQLGIGVMLHALSGGSQQPADRYYNRKIASVDLSDEKLTLKFDDGVSIQIYDDGQSCCEHRYITTDDDIQSLVGGTLVRIEAKDGPDKEDDYGCHESVFVEIGTDKGFVTLTNHNEHNGYYGGFGLTIKEV